MNTNDFRADKIEKILTTAAREGSAVLFTGQTGDSFVYGTDLTQLPYIISRVSANKQMSTMIFSLEDRLREFPIAGGPRTGSVPSIAEATPTTVVLDKVFGFLQNRDMPTTFIIDFSEAIIPETNQPEGDEERIQQQIESRLLSASFMKKNHLITLISRIRPINAAFARLPGITTHHISLPEEAEREQAVKIMQGSQTSPLALSPDMTTERLGRVSGGMTLDSLSRMRRSANRENPLTYQTTMQRKKDLIKSQSGGILTIHDAERDMDADVAGLAQIRQFIANTKEEGSKTARALLLGPPGTGKTLCATAIAKAMDTIPISLANVKNMWVGESERNLRQAIDIIETNAPVTLILDECDQLGMGSRTGSMATRDSSSVDSSLRGMLLEWLGDIGANNGISVIAMSNNAEGVDPAFRDRLKTIPVLEANSAADKAKIAAIQLRRQGIQYDEEGIARAFEESDKNFTGRQIVTMLGRAVRNAKRRGAGVGYEDMKTALANMLHAFGHAEELMSLIAVKFTMEKEYLPWVAAGLRGESGAQAPRYMRPFLSADGYVDEKLDERIAELRARRM